MSSWKNASPSMSAAKSCSEHCDRLLKQAEAKVEKLTFGAVGAPNGTEPLDPQ